MERESQRLLESVMKLIAAQFGPDCEVVLHDWSKDYESTIVAIENGHVSGRKVGDGGSNLGLEVMRGTTDGSTLLNYITQTQDGRMLRQSSPNMTDEKGNKLGALCINLDVTEYIMMQHRLSGVTLFPCVRPGEQEVSKEFFTNDVSELLDYLMKEGTEQLGKAPEEMTKEEKKQVISYLDQKGALLITKSGPKICRYLGISKFTLYNYLDEIHSEQEQKTKQYP